MRYLVFGDVHANLTALDVVLAASRERGVEGYLFVGDLIGYGPEPLECIEQLLALQKQGNLAWAVGNHEMVVLGEVGSEGYNAEAVETLAWTKDLIESKAWAKEFIQSGYPSVCANDLIWLAHDSLAEPGSGSYHRWPRHAKSELACLRFNGGRVCFYGHTHMMRAEIWQNESGIVLAPMDAHTNKQNDPHPLHLQQGELGWIGTGSVGFPTNPERRAEFLILDDADPAQWVIEKYEMKYPREKARERVQTVLGGVCSEKVVERLCRWL